MRSSIRSLCPLIVAGTCAAVGCGDDANTSASAGGSTGTTAPSSTSTGVPTTSGGSGGTSEGTSQGATGVDSDSEGSVSSGGPLFDVGTEKDFGAVECGCGNTDFSYIWIANSSESTVTKLNTRTLVEEGRYLTRGDAAGNPSRTSVSIDGRAVAVANRHTGLIKIWARPEDCVEKNGVPGIQTSTGKNDVLPWDQDECVAWYNDFAGMTVQRPVAWTSGVLNNQTCEYEEQKVWTITGKDGGPGTCGASGVFVHLVDGDDGTVESTVQIPEDVVQCAATSLGPYGAAVDQNNDLWFHTWGWFRVFRVRYDTLTWEEIPTSGSYGITTDSKGRVWWGDGPRRYDPMTGIADSYIGDLPGAGGAGIAEDLKGRMWTATSGGVGWVDRDTMVVGDKVMLPDQSIYRGISVDIDGYIWAIPLSGTKAYKIDPDNYQWEVYDGLNNPYTYSDMTGGALNKVNCGVPQG